MPAPTGFNHEPRRKRKLLVSRRELAKLSQEVERAGRTIVPLKFYFNDRGIAKLLIGTATGRKELRQTQRRSQTRLGPAEGAHSEGGVRDVLPV